MNDHLSPIEAVQHRNDNHRLRAIAKVVENLLSDSRATAKRFSDITALRAAYPEWKKFDIGRCGSIRLKSRICLWLIENNIIEAVELERHSYPFSKLELSLFDSFEKALDGTFSDSRMKVSQNASRIGTKYSLGNLMVAHHIRGTRATNFWTISMMLDELQELALLQYEGRPCSSGFIFVSQPDQQIKQIEEAGFAIDPFAEAVSLEEQFFEGTISHRYVDGRNSFYVVDNLRNIYGIARIENPGQYSIYDRSAFRHLDGLMAGSNGRMVVAFVGRNKDVIVKAKGKAIFKWKRLYWGAIDLNVMDNILAKQTGLPKQERDALIASLLTCSDLRFGALILIADNRSHLPKNIGKIDNSQLSEEVININRGKKISEIISNGSAIGVLTADGSTTLDGSGELLSSGNIIDLSIDELKERPRGGGRTQAAQAASMFGLAIKVSEDGPISFFRKGKKLIEYSF